jgi:general secretion pathway protein A
MTRQGQNDDMSRCMTFLGLRHNPFPVAPDDANFYLSATIEEIVAEIIHGVCTRKGFIILTGDVGLGKTTTSRRVISLLGAKDVTTSLVLHTSLQEVELLRAINHDFGLSSADADPGMGAQMKRLNDFLLSQYGQGKNCAIIIDDAQNLNRSSLELIRMISNLEVDQKKLVQVLLVGQTELEATLKCPDLRQLNSRIVIRKTVRGLSREELRNYIAFKLSAAGDQGRISLTPPALRRLHRMTRGNFRQVNLIMDRCLYACCLNGQDRRIRRKTLDVVAKDLYPRTRRIKNGMLALAASVLLPMVLTLGSWTAPVGTRREPMAGPGIREVAFRVPQDGSNGGIHRNMPDKASVNKRAIRGEPVSDGIDPAVAAFLDSYQLSTYAAPFQRALKEGTLNHLTHRIYTEKGYQLIQLPNMTDEIRRRYGALTYTLTPGQPPVWLLFWRPHLTLKRFYYQYRGQEIYELQKLFFKANFYQDHLDGIVGPHLMRAVIDFQQGAGLPVTGFPDAATLFKLCHQQEADADV